MKTSSRLLALLLCLVMCCSVAAPVSFVTQAQAASSSSTQTIKLNKTKATLYNGKRLKLKVSGTKETVKWSSSDKKIATVKNGVVTTRRPGTVKIKAKVAGKTLACKLTVKSALRATKQDIVLNKGEATKITVVLYSANGDVSCKIADRSIAAYKFGDWDGYKIRLKIRGKAVGTTTAVISNTETSDKVKLNITVKEPAPVVTKKALTASATSISLDRGATKSVTLTAAPAAQILVSVAQPSIASCKWNGSWNNDQSTVSVTGLSGGSTVVTLTNATTKETVNLNVTVNCNHVYSDTYKVESPATCTTAGLEAKYCIYCGQRGESRSIPAAGHDFAATYTVDKAATCTSEGVQSRHCTKCDATTDVTAIPKTTHVFSAEFTVDVQPTCTTAGSKSKHCTICGEKQEITEIPATGHTFGDTFTIDVQPTCTTAGSKSKTCTVCGEKAEVTEIPATGHDYSTTFTVDQAATCTAAGSKSKHCTKCDAKTEVTEIPATGHQFGAYATTKEATCQSAGSETRTCSVCGQQETRAIPQKDHQYSTTFTTDTAATCTTAGSKSKHCIYCGAKSEVTEIPATGHSFGAWVDGGSTQTRTCSVCGYKETKDKTPEPGELFSNPLSGQSGQVIEYQEYSFDPVRKVKINLKNILTGEKANELAESENSFNEDAGGGYSWRFFIFDLTYVSTTGGANDVLKASDVIYRDTFFKSTGAAVQQKGMATFSGKYKGSGVFDIELYPGASSEVIIALLMRDDSGDVLLRVPKSGGKENTWISMKAPELVIEDEPPITETVDPASYENIAAYAIAMTKGKLTNPSTFQLNNIMYRKNVSVTDWSTEESVTKDVVYIWYSAGNNAGGTVDGYTMAWHSTTMMGGLSSIPYYNIDQHDGTYVVVELNAARPNLWDDYVSVSKTQKILNDIGVYHYTMKVR